MWFRRRLGDDSVLWGALVLAGENYDDNNDFFAEQYKTELHEGDRNDRYREGGTGDRVVQRSARQRPAHLRLRQRGQRFHGFSLRLRHREGREL